LLKNFDGLSCPDLRRTVSHSQLKELLAKAEPKAQAAPTTRDDMCFWLYSSGSTGAPKGTVHLHSHLIATAELYAKPILGIRESDLVFSAAKLFFAYGLGNALTFPMAVGATTVLMAERPTPDAVFKRLVEKGPTIFYGVPTLYAALLASPSFPKKEQLKLRICTSAGEALPEGLGKRWTERTGVEILDGIGSTEMLHIFISNRPGDVRYGTTGKPVPGYEVRLIDDQGNVITKPGELGELQISGPTSAIMYWNQRSRTKDTFRGPWTRSGDKYSFDEQGYYTYGGRSDDMLKVSGIYVSPVEVEAALISHEGVLEAAVVGVEDEQKLVKPKAFVVLKPGNTGDEKLKAALQQHVKDKLAPYKYPRWIEFATDLPKTATGKIQRFKLRS
jgi:benzoate-CoA ligase